MRSLSTAVLLGTASVLAIAGPARAQTVPSSETSAQSADAAAVEGEVVVTAQRREQRLQDVPISVSVTSGDQLAKQNLVTLESVATRLPAIKVASNTNSDTITIRGVGSGQNAGFEQAVGTFIDGVYRGRSRSTRAALFDAERVEVLKGPQTTFFGNNTVAGAINITTRKPSTTFGAEARALYTPNIGEYALDLSLTGPLSDTVSARIAGQVYGTDGWVKNTFTGEDGPRFRDIAGRLSLRWEPSSSFRSDLRFDVIRNRDKNTSINEVFNCPPPTAFGAAAGACAAYLTQRGAAADTRLDYRNDTIGLFFDYDMKEVAWTNAFDVGSHKLTSTTSYFKHDVIATDNATPLALVSGFPDVFARLPFANDERDKNFTQELRLESPTTGLFQYMVGAYYLHDKLRSDGYTGFYQAPIGAFAPGFYTAADKIAARRQLRQKTETVSAFAAVTIAPSDPFRVNLGLRYVHVRKDASRFVVIGTAGPIPLAGNFVQGPAGAQALIRPRLGLDNTNFVDPVGKYEKLLPSASVQYDVTQNVTLYASYSKGFKAGGYAEANLPNTFESETANAYEVGIKGSAGPVFFTLDAFRSDFKDLQTAFTFVTPAGTVGSIVNNAAGSRSQGIEGSLNWRVSPMFRLTADVAYVDAIFTDYTNAPCTEGQLALNPTTCIQNQSGRTRPFSPEWSGSVGASMTLPIGTKEIRIDPRLYFSSKYNVSETLDPFLEQKGFAKADLRIGFGPSSGKWELAVIGKNLTDRYTYNRGRPLATSRGTFSVLPDPPRTVSIAATVRY